MNFSKTTVRDLDDLKVRIIQKIEAIRKETLHNVFMGLAKRLNFCISIKGISFK
jgi:hypothetical protein